MRGERERKRQPQPHTSCTHIMHTHHAHTACTHRYINLLTYLPRAHIRDLNVAVALPVWVSPHIERRKVQYLPRYTGIGRYLPPTRVLQPRQTPRVDDTTGRGRLERVTVTTLESVYRGVHTTLTHSLIHRNRYNVT